MKIPKGLKVRQIRAGTGDVAEAGKVALIHYDCYLPRGEKCESSRDRGFPAQLIVGERLVHPALAYTVPGMAVGEVRMVKVSPNLTYREANKILTCLQMLLSDMKLNLSRSMTNGTMVFTERANKRLLRNI